MYADSNPFNIEKDGFISESKKSFVENPCSQVGSWNDRFSHDRFRRCQEMSALEFIDAARL